VNRKAKLGVKKHSAICLNDFSVVAHEKAPSGYLLFIRSYLVVKKDIDKEAHQRWAMEQGLGFNSFDAQIYHAISLITHCRCPCSRILQSFQQALVLTFYFLLFSVAFQWPFSLSIF
jgi:hypothetical protein